MEVLLLFLAVVVVPLLAVATVTLLGGPPAVCTPPSWAPGGAGRGCGPRDSWRSGAAQAGGQAVEGGAVGGREPGDPGAAAEEGGVLGRA
jgi:hypothetical protein